MDPVYRPEAIIALVKDASLSVTRCACLSHLIYPGLFQVFAMYHVQAEKIFVGIFDRVPQLI